MMQSGSIGWHELHSTDWEKVWPFYERLFGWTKDQTLDLGPIGPYQLFKSSATPIGGMMTRPQAPHSFWLFYFVVDDIDAGLARVKTHGGTPLHEPREVPGGAWVITAEDPQGALFALVGMRKA
jgi:predicted enzyme related to lactoylglutathione lyase